MSDQNQKRDAAYEEWVRSLDGEDDQYEPMAAWDAGFAAGRQSVGGTSLTTAPTAKFKAGDRVHCTRYAPGKPGTVLAVSVVEQDIDGELMDDTCYTIAWDDLPGPPEDTFDADTLELCTEKDPSGA